MPDRVVVGFGCERGITAASVLEGLRCLLHGEGWTLRDVRRIGTIELKRDEPGLRRAVGSLDTMLDFWRPDQLSTVESLPNPSEVVRRAVGVPGVAEPAALLSGSARSLLVGKTVQRPRDRRMTLSVAPWCVDPEDA